MVTIVIGIFHRYICLQGSAQEYTKESHFILLYGRDFTLFTLDTLSHEHTPYMADLDDYKSELTTGLCNPWKLA